MCLCLTYMTDTCLFPFLLGLCFVCIAVTLWLGGMPCMTFFPISLSPSYPLKMCLFCPQGSFVMSSDFGWANLVALSPIPYLYISLLLSL